MKLFKYSTNNSGGYFCLSTKNWKALEKAGWKLFNHEDFIYENQEYKMGKDGVPLRVNPRVKDKMFNQYAQYAFKKFNSLEEAISEFEIVADQDYNDEGCSCCGNPHSISEV